MVFAKPVGKVLFVVLLHEALIVNEKNISGHGDRSVAIIDGSGCVEQLEAFGSLAGLGRFFIKSGT